MAFIQPRPAVSSTRADTNSGRKPCSRFNSRRRRSVVVGVGATLNVQRRLDGEAPLGCGTSPFPSK